MWAESLEAHVFSENSISNNFNKQFPEIAGNQAEELLKFLKVE